jgi:putative ABC transport system permease protein
VLAILIGCMGLYGLVSYMAERKTKEIGIRKVLGASVSQILALFTKEFGVLVLVGFVLAAPTAYWVLQSWLENYAYRITIGPGIFLLSLLASALVASVTVGYKAIRASSANPVEALHYE